MNAKNIRLSVYVKAGEVAEFKQKLESFLPEGAIVEESVFEPEKEGGVFKENLVELSCVLSRMVETRETLENIFSKLRERDVKKIISEVGARTDESCNFYMRLGKKDFFEGNLILREKDAMHLKIRVEVYPADKEKAITELESFLGELS